MRKKKENKSSKAEDTTTEQQLEKDALHIIKTRHNRDYSSLKEINLVEILKAFPTDA